MIFDQYANHKRYLGISNSLDLILSFLQTSDLTSLPLGRIDLDGSRVYCNHFIYETHAITDDLLFESHTNCVDVHFILKGKELIAITPTSSLVETDRLLQSDTVLYTGAPDYCIPMSDHSLLVVFPNEGHMPQLVYEEVMQIDKIVFKIRLD